MAEPFLGSITIFAGNFAPNGWALCNGQLLAISQNAALFSLLGTTYGGNGQTTFALPDLRSRVPVHAGQGPGLSNYTLGQNGGEENVTLTTNQIPQHAHGLNAYANIGDKRDPANHNLAMEATGKTAMYSDQTPTTTLNAQSIGNTGGGQAHDNLQPYLTLNYIIAMQGIYPSRN